MTTRPESPLPEHLIDTQIDKLISDGQTQSTQQAQNLLTRGEVLCLTLEMSELLSAVQKISQYPSKYHMDEFKLSSNDSKLVAAINDPYVTLALQLKQSYDMGKLALFEDLEHFDPFRPVKIQEDRIVENFIRNAPHYLPELPYIRDDHLRSRALALDRSIDEPSEELYTMGHTKFTSVVNDLLYIRFPEQDIMKDVITYVISNHAASTWAKLYQLVYVDEVNEHHQDQDNEDDEDGTGIRSDEQFYIFLGALTLSNVLPSDEKEFVKIVTVLIEPIVKNFDEEDVANETAKDELESLVPGVYYEQIHVTAGSNEQVYMANVYGGDGALLIGTGTGKSLAEAESRAAAVALYKKSHLDRYISNIHDIVSERGFVSAEYNYNYEPEIHIPVGAPPVAPPPVRSSTTTTSSMMGQRQMNGYRISETPPPPPMSGPGPGTMVMVRPSGSLINQDYQRQRQEDIESIPLAPTVENDADVDKSSKQRLNDLLLELRYTPAEYKTSKLSNSDVQVMCIIENIQIARSISSNKKKAGHICAQYILSNWRFFFSKLPQRH